MPDRTREGRSAGQEGGAGLGGRALASTEARAATQPAVTSSGGRPQQALPCRTLHMADPGPHLPYGTPGHSAERRRSATPPLPFRRGPGCGAGSARGAGRGRWGGRGGGYSQQPARPARTSGPGERQRVEGNAGNATGPRATQLQRNCSAPCDVRSLLVVPGARSDIEWTLVPVE